jgi:hypothetical protein
MPAVPIVLAVTGASAAIGAGVATAIGIGTVSTAVATAIGTGVIAGGMTAAQGGDAGDVLKSAVVGGATSFVGGSIASGVGEAVAEATGSAVAGQIVGNVAAAGVTSGGDEEAMLRAGLLTGVGAGINAGRTAAVDEYLGSIDPDPYGARPGEEFDYLAAVGEPADISAYPPQDFGVPVSMDTPFYASKDAALSAGATAYAANPNGTFTYTYDDGSKVTIDSSSNVVDYIPSNDILQAAPDQQNLQAERDLEQKLAALNIAQRLAPTAVGALLEKNRPTQNPYGSYGTAGALGALSAGTTIPAFEDMRHLVARVGKPKDEGEFSSFLAPFFSKADVQTPFLNVEDSGILPDNNNRTETAFMQPYFNYGSESPIDQILNFGGDQKVDPNENLFVASGGAISPLMGTGTRYGRYALGGMATPLMAAGGKPRVDFRKGDAVTGPGDGQSDDIPAMLADGEFVFPADVVAAIGNGSTKAGSDKLYDMMHGIRKHARSAKPKDLPPEIKSPLDFLKK